MDRGNLGIIACKSGELFALRVIEALNRIKESENAGEKTHLISSSEIYFANKEVKTVINQNIRGNDVYIIQNIEDPLRPELSVNDNLMAVVTAIDAAHGSDTDRVTAVLPVFPYARQERKTGREGTTAKQVAHMLECAGASRVITLDIHTEAIGGFFNHSLLENLHASRPILRALRQTLDLNSFVVAAPDVGGARRARFFSNAIKTDLVVMDKARDYEKGGIASTRLVGEVEGKNVLVPDDMIATGGTLLSACNMLKEKGAKQVVIITSLPLFNGDAVEKFDRAHAEGLLDRVFGTDAVFHGTDFSEKHPWYQEVSIAPLFAEVIFNINRKRSVSALLD